MCIFKRKKKASPSAPPEIVPVSSSAPVNTVKGLERQRYSANNFLHFGRKDGEYPEGLDLAGTTSLLELFGTDIYSVGMDAIDTLRPYEPLPLPNGVHFCDFCAKPLVGSDHQVLKDGRERCAECSKTVVRDPSEIKGLFREVRRRMEQHFDIKFKNEIGVNVVNAKKLSQGEFTPTPGFDARAIGYVEVKRGRQVMMLENGAPRVRFMSTCAHELTHCWQNQTPYFQSLHELVSRGEMQSSAMLVIVEGHAAWTEVQYLFLVGEAENASYIMDNYLRRDDVYGEGFRLYMERYGITKGPVIVRDTPFDHPEGPLSEQSPE